MKKLTLPPGGFSITTLALMLLLVVAACENDDEVVNPVQPVDPVLKFGLGEDINVVVGLLTEIQPSNRLFSAPPGTTWSWEILSRPENSQVGLTSADQASARFQADVPGEYQLVLTGSVDEHLISDTLVVYAHSVTRLDRTYQVLFITDGTINSLCVYQDKLYAAGFFSAIGGVRAYGIASYDGNSWKPLGSGLMDDYNDYLGSISDMIEYKGELYVTGAFGTIGGINSPAVARWNGHQWADVPGLDLTLNNGFRGHGHSFEIFEGELYIEGNFWDNRQAPQVPVSYSILKWDGNQLTGVSTPFPLGGLKADRNHLYAISDDLNLVLFDGSDWKELATVNKGKEYTTVDLLVPYQEKLLLSVSTDTRGLEFYTWDGTQLDAGIPFSRKPSNYISTANVIDNILFIGGDFAQEVVGTKSRGLVSWDGEQWGVIEDGTYASISAIQSFQNQLFVVGYINYNHFQQIAVWQK